MTDEQQIDRDVLAAIEKLSKESEDGWVKDYAIADDAPYWAADTISALERLEKEGRIERSLRRGPERAPVRRNPDPIPEQARKGP